MAAVPSSNGIRVSLEELINLRQQGIGLSLSNGTGRAIMAGSYRSAFRGRGMDFEEVRAYQAGDDIRRMDWRVTARSNRPHTKLFREERERPVLLCVDNSASMHFGTRVGFKSVLAARIAALLGWAALENHDRVGTMIFANSTPTHSKPGGGKRALLHCLQLLAEASAETPTAVETTSFANSLLRLRYLARHGCLIVIISDFSGLDSQAERRLGALAQHNEILAIRVYDPLEAELPPPGYYGFSDGRHSQNIWTSDAKLRDQYRDAFLRRSEYLATLCRQHGIHWLSLNTTEDAASRLHQHLQQVQHRGYSPQPTESMVSG